ncbi:MAG TPA: Rieske (2Fe-2S) protein [Terriglobia bacterium]|nr:Rieske (2Fe-2S) protein [Terriglobia bacterium]
MEIKSRRRFLAALSLGLGTFAAALVGIPIIGFLVAPLIEVAPRSWRAVGDLEQFKVGTTVEVVFIDSSPLPWAGVAAKTAAWLRRNSESEFIAFSVDCTHLGCPVRWLPDAELFLCPCHGGVYYQNGKVASGPPPKPLPRYPVRVRDGKVEVLTSPIPITTS